MQEILKILDLSVRDGQMILVGTVVFFIFWRVMHVAVFKPFLILHEEREAATTGVTASSKELIEDAKRINSEVDTQINETRVRALTKKIAAITEAKKKAGAMVADAEKDAAKAILDARTQRKATADELKASLMASTGSLAEELAENILNKRAKGTSLPQ